MKKVLKIMGIIILSIVVLIVILLVCLSKMSAVAKDYYRIHITTSRRIDYILVSIYITDGFICNAEYTARRLNLQCNPTADRQPGTFPEASM